MPTQSAMHLIDRTDNTNTTTPGRISLPSIIAHFGEGSFSHPIDAPWETLLAESGPSSNLANGLKASWTHLQSNFQEASTNDRANDDSLLLTQDVSRAGFYKDGTFAPSITNAVTIELERSRKTALGTQISSSLNRREYERWAFEG